MISGKNPWAIVVFHYCALFLRSLNDLHVYMIKFRYFSQTLFLPLNSAFLPAKSTLQQLLFFLSDLFHNQINKEATDVLYLDFRKAFDTVQHDVLLQKLWRIGITGNLWLWFKEYLCCRHQCVSVNGSLSDTLDVTSGVPQGSILGPLLFLVFINDLPSCVKSSKVLLFADDAKCYQLSKDYLNLQADLDSLYLWSLSNLSFNSNKVCHLRFQYSSDKNDCYFNNYGTYYLGDRSVLKCSSHRDLGVIMTDDLSWSNHFSLIISKALRILGLLRRSFGPSTPVQVKRLLYLTLVRSKLIYCSVLWRPRLVRDIRRLESVQRRATKWILGDYKTDYRSRLVSLRLLPLMMVYEVNDVLFFLKSLSSPSPAFDIRNFVTFSSNPYRSTSLLHVLTKDNTSRHFYFNRLPRLWNSLPTCISSNLLNISYDLAKIKLNRFFTDYFVDKFDPLSVCLFFLFLLPMS